MGTFNSLVTLINLLQQYSITIAGAVAGLVFIVRCIMILAHTDNSPQGRSERWAGIRLALAVAFLIGAGGVLIHLFVNLGKMVQ